MAVPIAMTVSLDLGDRRHASRSNLWTSRSIVLDETLRLVPVLTRPAETATSESADITETTGGTGAPALASTKLAEDIAPTWLAKPLSQLAELIHLPVAELPGEIAIEQASIASAVRALLDVQGLQGPQPQIIARGDGGLQIVWYTPGRDLEIEVLADGKRAIVEFDGKATRRSSYEPDAAAAAFGRIAESLRA
jgi:hypothetical protein